MSTPAQTLSRAREQLSDAKAQDERSAEVLRSSQATLAIDGSVELRLLYCCLTLVAP